MKYVFTLVLLIFSQSRAIAEVPAFRGKLAMYDLSVSAGELVSNEKLGSMVTLQPGILWNFSSMNSRIGLHFLLDVGSQYGFTPISGIGISGYYYLTGLTSAYELSADEVLTQKTKPGLFTFMSVTPVNFNLNKIDKNDPTNNFSFSATMTDIIMGFGYEYPLKPNSILALEASLRDGSSSFNSQSVSYRGFGISLVYTTSYY